MIQYYRDLEIQVKKVNENNLSNGQIQKIYSTAFFISISVRTPGKTWAIYLGRGAGHEGVWLGEEVPSKDIRQKDRYLEYLRKYLISCSFIDLELDTQDRIIALHYQKYASLNSFLFFWKARKLYFLHYFREQPSSGYKLMTSWSGKTISLKEEIKDLFSLFDEIGRSQNLDKNIESTRFLDIGEILTMEEKLGEVKNVKHNPTFLERKKQNIEHDLRKAKQWEKLQNILDENISLDKKYELSIEDQNIKFDSNLNPYERRDLVYQKIKKLKRGEEILSKRLDEVSKKLSGIKTESDNREKVPIVKPSWGVEPVASNISAPKQENLEFKIIKLEDFSIGVGVSSRGNDQLRNKWASKDDYWFHLDGEKSAHAVLKISNDKTLSQQMINVAATIVAHYSQFHGEWIPVVYTQIKYLKSVAGIAGMVTYKKEKHLKCMKLDMNSLFKDE